jgi:hypothetical protein
LQLLVALSKKCKNNLTNEEIKMYISKYRLMSQTELLAKIDDFRAERDTAAWCGDWDRVNEMDEMIDIASEYLQPTLDNEE